MDEVQCYWPLQRRVGLRTVRRRVSERWYEYDQSALTG